MKRFLLHIIYITALLPFLGSCSQTDDVPTDVSDRDRVQLSLRVTTRALPQEGMEIGSGEPENMHLWVFGSVNDAQNTKEYVKLAYCKYSKIDSPSFFAGSDAFGNPVHTITDLDIPEGKKYTKMYFYVVLNSEESVTGLGDLNKDTKISLNKDTKISDLQALTFSGINQGKEDNEMLMYGMSELEINPHKTNYETSIEVERSVAKLEMYFTKNAPDRTLTINSVQLVSKVGKGYLVRRDLTDDVYDENGSTTNLFNNVDGSGVIGCHSSENYGDFSTDESNFKNLVTSYLLENPEGLDWTDYQVDDKYPETDSSTDVSKYYQLTVDYVIDGSADTEKFYLPKIERNHLYKIYVRARSTNIDLNWEVVPFDQVTNDIPTFE